MAQLKEIKRKIKSVQNTEKTTKAMKLVSTAKLKRAEEAAKRAKAYASKLNEMMHKIGDQVASCQSSGFESPYFNPVKNGVIDRAITWYKPKFIKQVFELYNPNFHLKVVLQNQLNKPLVL
jgi:beta-mannanase